MPDLTLIDGGDNAPTRERLGDWASRGACVGIDPDLMFPGTGESAAPAKAVCAACPVTAECLDHAIRNNERFGIWGGTSERERRRMHRDARQAAGVNVRGPIAATARTATA